MCMIVHTENLERGVVFFNKDQLKLMIPQPGASVSPAYHSELESVISSFLNLAQSTVSLYTQLRSLVLPELAYCGLLGI